MVDETVRLINLTGHSVNLFGPWDSVILESDGRARVDSRMRMVDRVHIVNESLSTNFFVPVLEITESSVVGLPDPIPGALFVVSGIVGARVKDRDDVVVLARQERLDSGRVTGARALLKVR